MQVLVVHSYRMLASLLGRVVREQDGMDVTAVEQSADGALEAARRSRPDVVVLDHVLPDGHAAGLAKQLHREHPNIGLVVITCSQDESDLRVLVEAGASGIVTKDHLAHEVVDAIRTVHTGGAAISPALLERILHTDRDPEEAHIAADLTPREREVLRLSAEGLSNQAIAARLFISYNTVRNHVQRILTKLGVHSKLEAAAAAVRLGMVTPVAPAAGADG